MSNIDKDIERCKELIKTEHSNWIGMSNQDAISNVLSELEELREDNYAYHQLMRMQNQREYRSKFLKDFKKEFGENVMPDYDEIYKRYDKQKKEIENLRIKNGKEFVRGMETERKVWKAKIISKIKEIEEKAKKGYTIDIRQLTILKEIIKE